MSEGLIGFTGPSSLMTPPVFGALVRPGATPTAAPAMAPRGTHVHQRPNSLSQTRDEGADLLSRREFGRIGSALI